MGGAIEFDPAAIDRAIAHLRLAVDAGQRDRDVVHRLQTITHPGEAPSTTAFHGRLVSSMAHLRQQHDSVMAALEGHIEMLCQAKRRYGAGEEAAARHINQVNKKV